ncbi:hypothetical protein RIF23_12485 [Lipingzhangella sp. LS1_29]|uniref:LVIVD repeat-containing protein n=1 Tax=Lipingzhangella rawalii TaxID=2055835 RepID=A0ABU2H803_9ACTN|nr:hypothetical protein [Lipingzhangella rawalii]MDS1271112.1 hypothetical protein [Lipingzhangella rawalii]
MPKSPPSHMRRLRDRARQSVALLGAGVLVFALGSAPTSADTVPDDVQTSDNVDHVANVPLEPPFEEGASWGTDLAFSGDYAIAGNYDGFTIYDISDPENPEITSQVVCPGGQMDVSVSGDLLYTSVDFPRASAECGAPSVSSQDPDGWDGIRIFDISDKTSPEYVHAVDTDCGSHTNTLVPGGDEGVDYIYVSSYSPHENFPNCQPPHDKISIIEVPTDSPTEAEVVNDPVLFPDGGNEEQDNLLAPTSGCHDITVYPERDLAAGACMGDGILMDISDPVEPEVVEQVQDENFAFWHSATFTNDGRTVLFTDELGGGVAPTCNAEVGPEHGANAIYEVDGNLNPSGQDIALEFASYFKIDRHQSDTENCVSHNGSLIPVMGKDYFVQSWYQGGVSVIDLNDPHNPEEIGYFERGPIDEEQLVIGGSWSAYWYNGHVYSSDITQGLDVLALDDRRLRGAQHVNYEEFNPQSQPRYKPGRG